MDYRLVIRGDKIRGANGRILDGDGDSNDGGSRVHKFFSLFGDGNVDNVDKAGFKSTFGKRSRDLDHLWYLDFNANGRVWSEDLALFLLGYCRSFGRR
jgi:hypothetical protein